jgi:hypothetical protein
MRYVLTVLTAALLVSRTAAAQTAHVDTVWRSTVGTRTVTVLNQWETTPLAGSYAVRTADETGASFDMPLTNARGTVSAIGLWNDRLIVIVRKTAVVVDLATQTVVDEFGCDSPAISVDGRVITCHPVSATGEVQPTTATYELGPAAP